MRKTTLPGSQNQSRNILGSLPAEDNLFNLDSRFALDSNISDHLFSLVDYHDRGEQTPLNFSLGTISLQRLATQFPQTNLNSMRDFKEVPTRDTANYRLSLADLPETFTPLPIGQSITAWGKEARPTAAAAKQAPETLGGRRCSVKALKLFEDFECSQEEDQAFYDGWDMPEPELTFGDKKLLQASNKGPRKFFPLGDMLEYIEHARTPMKTYKCAVCGREMKSNAALGGHMSRTHPTSSKAYADRLKTLKIRKGERSRRQFLDRV